MLTALLTISGNGDELAGVAFVSRLCWGRELLSLGVAHGQTESATKCGDITRLLIDIFNSRTGFLRCLKPEFSTGFIKYAWCFFT